VSVVGRRHFLAASGVLFGAPLTPFAQQAQARRVALVFTTSPLSEMSGPEPKHPGARKFLKTLREAGYGEGNLIYEPRSARGNYALYPEIFEELLRLPVDVIVTIGEDMTLRARAATSTVPIVMAVGNDPVAAGLVRSLAHPGTNVTGVVVSPTPQVEAKRLELLKEALPSIARVAFLGLRTEWESPIGQSVRAAARKIGVALSSAENTPTEYGAAFAAVIRDRADAVFVANSPVNFANRSTIVELGVKARLPCAYHAREFVTAGGFMSYGINVSDQFSRAALLVAKVLKGAKPADLPIEQPTKFELVVNVKAAKALGLAVPPSLLLRADDLIE
jgi:putative ABC transport system substrate-binding protein